MTINQSNNQSTNLHNQKNQFNPTYNTQDEITSVLQDLLNVSVGDFLGADYWLVDNGGNDLQNQLKPVTYYQALRLLLESMQSDAK